MTNISVIEEPEDLRKSVPSLSQTFDQQSHGELDLSAEAENQRELRKSGGSGNSTSGSNGGEMIVTQLDCRCVGDGDGSPKLSSADHKKVVDCCTHDLPPNASKSKNARFHKLFKNVPLEEYPIDSYSCAFKGDILLQGLMYVSQNWICFYSKIRARGRLLEIPLEKVISITREKLALIIPNAIGIQTADQKYVFGSFMSRDNTYKLLVTLWKHSQDSSDSINAKEIELPCYEAFTNSVVGQVLIGSHGEDDMTHSADISEESDSCEDNGSERLVADPLLGSAQSFSHVTRNSDGNGPASDKVPGLFAVRCIDGHKIFVSLSTFAVRLQKIPRTNLLLAVCSVLVVFLLLSAMGLTYKILLLQTRLELSHLWTPSRQFSFREQTQSSIYTLQSETHRATVHQLHDVLKANIELLQQVHQSLQSLQTSAASAESTPAK